MSERAAIYCRVSTSMQESDGTSLDTQLERCRSYCSEHGYEITREYREIYSGADLWNRQELAKLRQFDDTDVVVTYDIDRFSRDEAHLVVLFEEARRHNARIEFVLTPVEDTSEGRLLLYVRGYAASIERKMIRERTMRGRWARAQSGKPIPGPKPPYGYKWADDDKSALIVDESEAIVVRLLFQRYREGCGLTRICAELEAQGVSSPTGMPYWAKQTISMMLKNPYYKGQARAFQTLALKGRNGRFTTKRVNENSIQLPALAVPAIVSEQDWDYVNGVKSQRKLMSARNNKYSLDALLRGGFAKCGYCGSTMVTVGGQATGTYRCALRDRLRSRCPLASSMYYRKLDRIVWGVITTALSDPSIIEKALDRRSQRAAASSLESEVALLRKVLGDNERQQGNLVNSLARFSDPPQSIIDRIAVLDEQVRVSRSRLQELESALQADQRNESVVMSTVQWVEQVRCNLDAATLEQKRSVVEAMKVNATIYAEGESPRVVVRLGLIPDAIVSTSSSTGGRNLSYILLWDDVTRIFSLLAA